MRRLVALVLFVLLAASCSNPKKVAPPAQLVKFKAQVKLERLWSARIHSVDRKYSWQISPAVDGQRVYAAGHGGVVTAFASDRGVQLWKTAVGVDITAGLGHAQTLLFAGTQEGQLIAISKDDGRIVWRTTLSSEVLGNIQVGEDVVVVRCIDGKVFGIGLGSGRRLWIYERSVPPLSLRGVSSPVVAGDRVFVGFANGKLDALGLSDGNLLWTVTLAVAKGRSELDRLVDIDGDPVVGNNTVYAVAYQGQLAAVKLESGQTVWSRELSSYKSPALHNEMLVLVDAKDNIVAFDRHSGSIVWKQKQLYGRRLTATALLGNHVIVSDFQGYLHVLSLENGEFTGRYRFDKAGVGIAPVTHDGVVYVLGKGGKLAAFRIKHVKP